MADFLDDQRRMIADRLNELKPLVDEYVGLEAAAAALAGIPGSSSSARANGGKRPGRPRGTGRKAGAVVRNPNTRKPTRRKTATRAPAVRSAGRRRGSGKRSAEVLAAVQRQPGITIPEIAAEIGIKQNYLYRVLPGLQKEKKVKKDGKGWRATA
jgi:hypothetical protein